MYWVGKPTDILSNDLILLLLKQYRETPTKEIKDKIVQSNYGTVLDIISRYKHIYSIDQSDLFQEGILGLYKAMDKFDPTKGTKFSTYATYWINLYVYAFIKKQSRPVTVTVYGNAQLLKLKKSSEDSLTEEWGEKKFNFIKSLSEGVNLDSSFDDKRIGYDPKNYIKKRDLTDLLNKIIKTFPVKEKIILRCRFCLNRGKKLKLDDVGFPFEITRERIRQIEKKAIKRLKIRLAKCGINNMGDLDDN